MIIPALGRTAKFGYVYDARTNEFTGFNVFKERIQAEYIELDDSPNTSYKFSYATRESDKMDEFDIQGELKLRIWCGMIKVQGAASYIKNSQSTRRSIQCSYILKSLTKKESFNWRLSELSSHFDFSSVENQGTHVVIGIQYGGNGVVTLTYNTNEDNTTQDIKGNLEGKFRGFPNVTGDLSSGRNFDSELIKDEELNVKVEADVAVEREDNITTVNGARAFMNKLAERLTRYNNGKGVQVSFELIPIKTMLEHFKIPIAQNIIYESPKFEFISTISQKLREIEDTKEHLLDRIFELETNKKYFTRTEQDWWRDERSKFENGTAKIYTEIDEILRLFQDKIPTANQNLIQANECIENVKQNVYNFISNSDRLIVKSTFVKTSEEYGVKYVFQESQLTRLKLEHRNLYICFFSAQNYYSHYNLLHGFINECRDLDAKDLTYILIDADILANVVKRELCTENLPKHPLYIFTNGIYKEDLKTKPKTIQKIQSRNTAAESSHSEDLLELRNFINKIKFSPEDSTYEFNKSDFQEIQIINSSKNVVKLFLHIPSGFRFAVKQINIPHNRNNKGEYDKQLVQLIREVQNLALLQNTPKIVQFYGVCECEKQIWICMEAMDMSLKDLYTKMHQEFKHFPEELIGCIVVAIIDALEFCDFKEIIHRDIKPNNVLLNKSGEIKLSDFGESRVTENFLAITHRIGTITYWAPERFKPEAYDSRSDVWSFGITLIEIIVGQCPYKLIRDDIFTNSILLQNLIMDIDPKRLVEMIDPSYSQELTGFIQLCLNHVELRPKYYQLKKTEFYRRYADKTRENVEKIIGCLDVPVQKCQNTTVTDHGYFTGSHFPNENDDNMESENSLTEDTSINEFMPIKSESSIDTWDILEAENEDVSISSSSSTSSAMKKSLSEQDSDLNFPKNLSDVVCEHAFYSPPVNEMASLSIDNNPECKHHEDTITETREKPYALGYIPKMKKSMSTGNLTDMELPNFPLQSSVSLDTFEILRDLYGKWGENNFHRIYTSMNYENIVNGDGGINFGANPGNNNPNQGGGFPQGNHDPYWQHINQRAQPPIPPITQICITPNCKEQNKTCFCQHCPLKIFKERLVQANILLSCGILCSHKCCESNPPTFPTQPPPQQLPWSSPYQHVPLSIAPSTLATNQPYAQYCPSMSTPNIMGTNQFQPSRQPQLLTQQLLNTGQAYTDQEQSLIQTNFSHGSGSQPNFSGASSSNASLTGLDRMDTCTMFDQNTSNLNQSHQNGQQNDMQQTKPERDNRVHEKQHYKRKRIFLENLETKLEQLETSNENLETKLEKVEASNQEILNLLKNLNFQPNFPVQPAMPQEQVPLAIGNQPPSQQMGPNPDNIPGTSHPPTTALPEGYPVFYSERQQPLYTNEYPNGNPMAMATEPFSQNLSNSSPMDFIHLMKNPNQAKGPQIPPNFDPSQRNE